MESLEKFITELIQKLIAPFAVILYIIAAIMTRIFHLGPTCGYPLVLCFAIMGILSWWLVRKIQRNESIIGSFFVWACFLMFSGMIVCTYWSQL
jgi:hypothetical protein